MSVPSSEPLSHRDRGSVYVRRSLPAVAVVVVLGLAVSDWPLGWSVWFDHPLLAALVAGTALLLLTGAVVDAILRRHEARRWVDIGRGAAISLDRVFWISGLALFQLLGVGRLPLPAELESLVAPARAYAREVLPAPDPRDEVKLRLRYHEAEAAALCDQRLPVLAYDPRWRECAMASVQAIQGMQEGAIAQWISAFGALGDDEGFRRVAGAAEILDRAEAVVQQLILLADANVAGSEFDAADIDASAKLLPTQWRLLAHACFSEEVYWEKRHVRASHLDLSDRPISDRLLRTGQL